MDNRKDVSAKKIALVFGLVALFLAVMNAWLIRTSNYSLSGGYTIPFTILLPSIFGLLLFPADLRIIVKDNKNIFRDIFAALGLIKKVILIASIPFGMFIGSALNSISF